MAVLCQVYLFERNAELFSERPRQCVPVAVVMYNRVGSSTDAVDLRLGQADAGEPQTEVREEPARSAERHGDVAVVVGQAGRRRVVVGRPEKSPVAATTASEPMHQQTASHRTVSSSPSGIITKITISNECERPDVAEKSPAAASGKKGTAVESQESGAGAAGSSLPLADQNKSTTSTGTAAETPVADSRSHYSHLIRRRRKSQPTSAVSPRDQTPSVRRPSTDELSLSPLPQDDSPLSLVQRQKALVGDITRRLSTELTGVTSFLRATKPAHIDDRELVAVHAMQRVSAAFGRLTPVCLAYRQFCRAQATGTCPGASADVAEMRGHEATLRRCREQLATSFGERRDVILQTPIAGEQRLFTFVWLQRHAAAIVDCIDVVVRVLEAVLPPPNASGGQQTSPEKTGTPEIASDVVERLRGGDDAPSSVEQKPRVTPRLDDDCRVPQVAGGGRGHDQAADDARPPSLIPALKTDVVRSADEPPVLQPCNSPRVANTSDLSGSPVTAGQRQSSPSDRHCLNVPATRRVCSSPSDRLIVKITRPIVVKQEPGETVSDTAQSCTASVDAVPAAHAAEATERSELADHCASNGIITDTAGQRQVSPLTVQKNTILPT